MTNNFTLQCHHMTAVHCSCWASVSNKLINGWARILSSSIQRKAEVIVFGPQNTSLEVRGQLDSMTLKTINQLWIQTWTLRAEFGVQQPSWTKHPSIHLHARTHAHIHISDIHYPKGHMTAWLWPWQPCDGDWCSFAVSTWRDSGEGERERCESGGIMQNWFCCNTWSCAGWQTPKNPPGMTLLNLIQNRGLTSEGSNGNEQPSHTFLLLTENDFVLIRLFFFRLSGKGSNNQRFPIAGVFRWRYDDGVGDSWAPRGISQWSQVRLWPRRR